MDGKKSAAAVFIDLPKAFDTVDHVVLLKKCNSLGMRRIPLKWLRSYLSNRQQYVFVNNTSSTVKSITSGVPQGSILGPFLFSLYINDLDELNLQGNLHLYADDICLIYMGESREEIAQKMQFDLDALHVYMSAHRLSINIKKTKLMVFTSTGPFTRGGTDISVTIAGSKIEQVQAFKYLGLELGHHLNWKAHIDSIMRKINPVIRVLFRLRNTMPKTICMNIYYALVHSHLHSLSNIWGAAANISLKNLVILQKRALKILLGLPGLTPSIDVYKISHVFSVGQIIYYNRCLYVFKITNDLLKTNVPIPSLAGQTHNYRTRSVNNYYLESVSSNRQGLNAHFRASFRLFNQLPNQLKSCRSLFSFKRKLQDRCVETIVGKNTENLILNEIYSKFKILKVQTLLDFKDILKHHHKSHFRVISPTHSLCTSSLKCIGRSNFFKLS